MKIKTKYRLIKLSLVFACIISPFYIIKVQAASYDEAIFEAALTQQGFPESYKPYLRALKEAHPSWNFVAFQTNLDWSTVLDNEAVTGRSLLSGKAKSWYSTSTGDYTWATDTYTPRDGTTWFQASRAAVAYYIDPRNWLSEKSIFQFESLSYVDGKHTAAGVDAIISGTFMAGASYSYLEETPITTSFTDTIMAAARYSMVSPYHIASRIRQEIGVTASKSVSGDLNGCEGYYNFFNIGATPGVNTSACGYQAGVVDNYVSIRNGLTYAKSTSSTTQYLLPWNNQYKAILGGSYYIGLNYINAGQNTLYLEKFDVDSTKNGLYWHQYMTNLNAPDAEAQKIYTAYNTYGLLNSEMTFIIPVYKNMTAAASPKPIDAGSPNNWLKSLTVTGYNITPTFDLNTNSVGPYSLIVDNSVTSVTINAEKVSSTASLVGTGVKNLEVGENRFSIDVTAENGEKRTYVVNIVRESAQSASLKDNPYLNENMSMTRMAVGTTISQAITNLKVNNPTASIVFKDTTGKTVDDADVIKTGMTVSITLDGKTSDYTVVVYGDVTGDGQINVLDLLAIQKHILNLNLKTDYYKIACDANKNGEVNVLDLLLVQKHILGLSTISQ